MMSNKIKVPKATSGFGYAGVWHDGSVGWFSPQYVNSSKTPKYTDKPVSNPNTAGERFFLCKITMTPVLDKNGRPITRIVPKIKP